MSYLSPGVYINEIDNSTIVPSVSTSTAFFAGNFSKGPIEQPFLITNKKDLEYYFGKPSDKNYNEWFQCYKFLDYADKLVVSRIFSETGTKTRTGIKIPGNHTVGDRLINGLESVEKVYKNSIVTFEGQDGQALYKVKNIDFDAASQTYSITITLWNPDINEEVDEGLKYEILPESEIIVYAQHQNAGVYAYRDITNPAVAKVPEFNQEYRLIKNFNDFEYSKDFYGFENEVKLRFFGRTAGDDEGIEISIVNSFDFINQVAEYDEIIDSAAEAFQGVSILNIFDYKPVGEEEIGIVIRKGDTVEKYIVSFDPEAVDANGKSKYVETVINENSQLVYVTDNRALGKIDIEVYSQPNLVTGEVTVQSFKSYIYSALYRDSQGFDINDDFTMPNTNFVQGPLELWGGESPIVSDLGSVEEAYMTVEDKELYPIDIIIGNELDEGKAAALLADKRQDCIAFIGASYKDVVGMKAAVAVDNLTRKIKNNPPFLRTMFASYFGNYIRIFDNFAKKFRWINLAGDMAGLRANTNTNQASWWASAGLKRGKLRNIDRISFSPNQAQRDILYSNNINPVVNFPGEGNLVWGQKTLINYASSFDRINVRGLFNVLERAMAKAAKSQTFEFNDVFTRNAILAMFNPFLSSVKAGRGIEDFLVVCDETNNTPDVISRNELVVDIYIKPMYAAEFIKLNFNNVGTRSFATVIGA